jgi:chromosome segregation ATPase
MDQELRAYFDERFADINARSEIGNLRGEVGSLREEVGSLRGEVGSLRGETTAQFAELREENRHAGVLLEGMRSDLRLVAEGVVGVTEQMGANQQENRTSLQEVKEALAPFYVNLDGRVKGLDQQVQSMTARMQIVDARVKILESRAERQTRDVLDVIREKFGKPHA